MFKVGDKVRRKKDKMSGYWLSVAYGDPTGVYTVSERFHINGLYHLNLREISLSPCEENMELVTNKCCTL